MKTAGGSTEAPACTSSERAVHCRRLADLRCMRSTSRRVMLPPCGAGRPLALPIVRPCRYDRPHLVTPRVSSIDVHISTVGTGSGAKQGKPTTVGKE